MFDLEILNYYLADHQRLSTLFVRYVEAYKQGSPAAIGLFQEYYEGLKQHMKWEDQSLFPAYEGIARQNNVSELLHDIMIEHRGIHKMVSQLDDIHKKNIKISDELHDNIRKLMESHQFKETKIIYPAVEKALSSDQKHTIFSQMAQDTHGPTDGKTTSH
jgi:iron-sulfur cluster repair protein YtfE (RIC family)